MKKFAILALLLSLGVFATGCNKTDTKKATDAPPAMDTAPPATDAAPATPPAEPAK